MNEYISVVWFQLVFSFLSFFHPQHLDDLGICLSCTADWLSVLGYSEQYSAKNVSFRVEESSSNLYLINNNSGV